MTDTNFNIPPEELAEFVRQYVPEDREIHEAVLTILLHKPGAPEEDQTLSAVSGFLSNNEIRRAMLDTAKEMLK